MKLLLLLCFFVVVGSDACTTKANSDVVGSDLASKGVGSAAECCDFCKTVPGCNAASLFNNVCYAKAGTATTSKTGVTAVTPSGSCSTKTDSDVIGSDLASKGVGSAAECCNFCKTVPGCNAASLFNNVCYAKAGTATTSKSGVTAVISGSQQSSSDSCSTKTDADVIGSDLASKSVGSAAECCSFCKTVAGCNAASLFNNVCYAKAGTATTTKAGVTAVIKSVSGNQPPPPPPPPSNQNGILLTNAGETDKFCLFQSIGGPGTWGSPTMCNEVKGGSTLFFPVPNGFVGRIQRGQTYPATWVEFDTKSGFADVSLIQGCDSPATITCTDGSCRGFTVGFTPNGIIEKAPKDALFKKPEGNTVLKNTEFNPILFVKGSETAANYERNFLGTSVPFNAFVRADEDGRVSDSVAPNKQWAVTFYPTTRI